MTVPRWVKGAALLAVTLGAGVVLGVGYERRFSPAHRVVAMDAHHLMHRLALDLGLDSAQHQAIVSILARYQGAVDSTWHALQPQVHATLDSAYREISGVLRPDQLEKFRQLVNRVHSGHRAR